MWLWDFRCNCKNQLHLYFLYVMGVFFGWFLQVGKCFFKKKKIMNFLVVFKVLVDFQEWRQCDIVVASIDTRLDSSKALDEQRLIASILFWVDSHSISKSSQNNKTM